MSSNQMPVLTLDFSDEKIQKLQSIANQFKSLMGGTPGGAPLPVPVPPKNVPVPGADRNPAIPKGFMSNLNKESQATLKTFTLINKTLKVTTSTLKGLFTTTISWGVKLAALAAGGPLGYNLMARRMTQQLKDSQGLNMTTGQVQAAHNVFGSRFTSTDSVMQALATAQRNPGSKEYRAMMALGLRPEDDPGSNLPHYYAAVDRVRKQYGSSALQWLHGAGVDIDAAELNRVKANSRMLPELQGQYQKQSSQLDKSLSDGTQKGYQNVTSNLSYNSDRMINSFMTALSQLSGPIMQLSNNLTNSITKFLNGPNGKELFKTIGDALRSFGDWLGSSDFQNDLKTFSDCIKVIIRVMGAAISWIADKAPELKVPKSVEQARKDSYFSKPLPGESVADAQKKHDATAWGFAKAAGQTLWGIGKTIGGNMFPDFSSRMHAGGWANYQKGNLARGLRNNNPGNLNFAGQAGASMEDGPNGRFAVFPTMTAGISALDKQLGRYLSRGKNTISDIVHLYAPGADHNNEQAYSRILSKATGLGVNDKIDGGNTQQIVNLIRGIIDMENGNQGNLIHNSDILTAMAMNRGTAMSPVGVGGMRVSLDVNQKPGADYTAQLNGAVIPQ